MSSPSHSETTRTVEPEPSQTTDYDDGRQERLRRRRQRENNTLYVGTGGGTILVVNPVDMTAVTRLEAYTTAVRCLSVIKMIKPFARI